MPTGLSSARVVLRHVLPNAILPILSVIGPRFGALLGGAELTETIFNWPGMGEWTFWLATNWDFPSGEFALGFGFTLGSVEKVGGHRGPEGTARVSLTIVDHAPEAVVPALRAATG